MDKIKIIKQYYINFFKPLTLDEILNRELMSTVAEIKQCDHVILTHQFQKHLVTAKQNALIEWIDIQKRITSTQTLPTIESK